MLKLRLENESFVDLKKNEVGDIVDQAFTMWEKDRAIDISENDKKTLHEIDAALQRLATGVFGHCTQCGFPIDERRLDAIPWATRCVDAKACAKNKADAVAPKTAKSKSKSA